MVPRSLSRCIGIHKKSFRIEILKTTEIEHFVSHFNVGIRSVDHNQVGFVSGNKVLSNCPYSVFSLFTNIPLFLLFSSSCS